ncbi:golgin subfamily A member 6-like protein 7 [Palaemon carinicauda]|uniref:golgin subfamily A member 6-like protein 7 n=1 Tax=Palaemon carinicauda TaxID=392227 RepID=UPI0035B61AEA
MNNAGFVGERTMHILLNTRPALCDNYHLLSLKLMITIAAGEAKDIACNRDSCELSRSRWSSNGFPGYSQRRRALKTATAVVSQDGFLGRWLQRCPWIGGLWKAREELKRCELGLRQVETEALRFEDELKSAWFVGKLLSEFDFGERKEEALSNGNKNFYIGMAAASVIFTGIMLARSRMAGKDVDNSSLEEYVPEMEHGCDDVLDGNELKMETGNRTTLMENLKAENDKLRGQIKEMGIIVEINENMQSDCTEKDLQMKELENFMGNIRNENEAEKAKLESECVEKDLQMKELENMMGNIRNENEVMKKEQNQKHELVKELKMKLAEKAKLESECVEKDLHMKELENFMGNIRKENEVMKKEQNQKHELEVGELKEEKTKLESECTEKDLQMKELENFMGNIRKENEVRKKEQNQKNELVKELKKEVGEMKAEKAKLESECVEKDLHMKELENFMGNIRKENEVMKKEQNQKHELVKELKKEVGEMKAEKAKLESECVEKDLHMKELENFMGNIRKENEVMKKE